MSRASLGVSSGLFSSSQSSRLLAVITSHLKATREKRVIVFKDNEKPKGDQSFSAEI